MTIPWLHNCAHSDDAWCLSCVAQLGNEAADLRSRVAELEAHRTELDCRYAGKWADSSGSHCPPGSPCMRCQLETAREELEQRREHMQRGLPMGIAVIAARPAEDGEVR